MTSVMRPMSRFERLIVLLAAILTVLAAILHVTAAPPVLIFIGAGLALAVLAALVGAGTEHLGSRLGAGATGVLQSALGNLPELFFGLFALQKGLVTVVQAALIGSILGNSLFVLGLAFLVGGLRHGTQKFNSEAPRMIATLTLLAVAALAIPTLATKLHTPAESHSDTLSLFVAILMLVIFVISIPVSFQSQERQQNSSAANLPGYQAPAASEWPLWLALVILAAAGIGSAFVADWFASVLSPAMATLGLSDQFTGLVIVALAGNAVENVVGIQFAAKNQPDISISVILNSSLQVALALIPALILLSFVLGTTHLTLVMPPLLVAAMGLTAALGAIIVYDGESTYLEGVALIGLYGIIAAAFWWG